MGKRAPRETFRGHEHHCIGKSATEGDTLVLRPGESTPMPWINVVGQPNFGFQVSATGSGFTWSENSQQNPLTAWSNDAVCDPASEAIYVRDDESGELWSPTAAPRRHSPAAPAPAWSPAA